VNVQLPPCKCPSRCHAKGRRGCTAPRLSGAGVSPPGHGKATRPRQGHCADEMSKALGDSTAITGTSGARASPLIRPGGADSEAAGRLEFDARG
jgi:hypothetical protein